MSTPPLAPAAPTLRFGRSVWSLLAGFLFVVFASLATDALFHALHVFPNLGEYTASKPLILATAYRFLYGVMGSYLTARLAPFRPMLHAMIGGFIGVAIGTVGAIATWNKNFGPHWYPIALIVLALPQAWLGGWLFLRRPANQPPASS
ncbi:MAG TPA: hypothetical protein VL128_07945 [Candidatus Eisenbacteria bacterium]|nr:hypothetical protein [Candidatus Eisenbacteria bacterium]